MIKLVVSVLRKLVLILCVSKLLIRLGVSVNLFVIEYLINVVIIGNIIFSVKLLKLFKLCSSEIKLFVLFVYFVF